MSLLVKKLLEAANKSDGFEAWELSPIAAEYIQELEAQRDELLEALGWYAYVTEDANRYGITRDLAQAELRADRGKRALEAIAKAKGGSSIRGTSVNLILLDEFAEEAITVLEEQEIQTMREQRDELLEALEALVLDESKEYIPTRLWDAARAALAKAKGE